METTANDDIIRISDRYYILASSTRVDDRRRVLKDGDTFAVFDRHGDMHPYGLGEHGLYYEGTRFLSRFELLVEGGRPLLLSSTVKEDNLFLAVDLSNPDLYVDGKLVTPANTVHIFRSAFIWSSTCYTRLRLRNYSLAPVELALTLAFGADFVDIFEVRGLTRERRGRALEPTIEADAVELAYEGLDGVLRKTRLRSTPAPQALTGSEFRFAFRLEPHAETSILLTITCKTDDATGEPLPFEVARRRSAETLATAWSRDAVVYTSNEQFNDWLNRSRADLHMMLTRTPAGLYPYAGVPWYSTPFGRDGIIAALHSLWINPEIAEGVLRYLAESQAQETNPEQDAEPGKILHEARSGEMAALGEIPFGRYYGSVDATPLFVVLAGAYYERTGDRGFIERIWPNLEAALRWIDDYGDMDGDGFVEFERRSSRGLVVQGWRDSHDSVFHADGTLARGPIALCEVQGYVYAARRAAARLAEVLGQPERAAALERQAAELKQKFEESFWCEEIGSYALALDGEKRQCQVRGSSAGHCLFSGIASPERAKRVAETLLAEDMFSGWGIRTVSDREARYNPISYHNGSVWPHDNAMIACGLAQYGLTDMAIKVLGALLDASLFVELHRLPELFCGFRRRPGEGPTLYPVACAPQVWAATSVFAILQACLGLSIWAPGRQIRFSRALLPEFLQSVQIRNLRVGDAAVDLALQRAEQDVAVNVLRREGQLDVVIVK